MVYMCTKLPNVTVIRNSHNRRSIDESIRGFEVQKRVYGERVTPVKTGGLNFYVGLGEGKGDETQKLS